VKILDARILIIDADTGVVEFLKNHLGNHHVIESTGSGIDGIAKGSSSEYDIYFISMSLPDISGRDVLHAIRKVHEEAICIMMSDNPSIDSAVQTTQMGAYNYISKPFDPEKIIPMVHRALERRWYILEARRLREERENNLAELSVDKSRLSTVINSIDDGILVINQNKEIIFYNPRFLQLIDTDRQILIGDSMFRYLPQSLQKQICEILQKAESEGKTGAIKQELVIKPPLELVVMANTAPIFGENGQCLGVVSVLRDITEMKQLEQSKSRFVNMVAHELKAPLAAIHSYLKMILDNALGDDIVTYNTYMKRSLERTEALMELINDLMNIFRMDSKGVKRNLEKVEVADLLENTVDLFKPQMEEREISVNLALKHGLFIKADPEEIRRVFTNLISNAIKYNKYEGNIDISCVEDGRWVKVTVKDTGIGMTADEKDRLFQEFFRAKNKFTRDITGTGLGLAILKKIVDEYAGRITVETEFGKGSTFTVYLPRVMNGE
jgi:PAS domain S-box-containing protein